MTEADIARNISLVRKLCEEWPWLSREGFRELLAHNCVYRDVPLKNRDAVGPDAAFEKLSALKADWDISFDIVNIAGSESSVLVERVERFHNRAGAVEDWTLSCVGVFELADGKVSVWKDYWNLADAEPLMRYQAIKTARSEA